MTRQTPPDAGPGRDDDVGQDAAAGEVEVFAAGGLVVDDAGRVLVVHRPRYDDWSFPKGKLDPGETIEQCALREVAEETGLTCRLGEEVARTRYRDRKGRPKCVRYWSMRVVAGAFEPNDEVDAIRWVTPDVAAAVLTYARDAEVLRSATGTRPA